MRLQTWKLNDKRSMNYISHCKSCAKLKSLCFIVQNLNPYVVIYFCIFALPFKSDCKPSMLISYTFSYLVEFDGNFFMATFGNFGILVRFDCNCIMLT
jgi:hypothetical protein